MKKINLFFIAIVCLLLTFESVQAQGLYARAGLGYGIGITPDEVGFTITNIGEDSEKSETNYATFGGGINGHVAVGYMFGEHFGLELGAAYLYGSDVTVDETTNSAGGFDKSISYTRQLRVLPSLVVDAAADVVSPYARFGIVVPVLGGSFGERRSDDPALVNPSFLLLYPTATSFSADSDIKGRFSLGFNASVGASIYVGDYFAIYGEAFYQGLRIKRNTYEVTSVTVGLEDGTTEDALPRLTEPAIQALQDNPTYILTEYKDELSVSEIAAAQAAGNYGTKDNPALAPAESANFSSIGINIGVKFDF